MSNFQIWPAAAVLFLASVFPVLADQEASNVAHVASGTHGRCFAKSIPTHVYDPHDGPRQQGTTCVFRVSAGEDVLIHEFDWFSQNLSLRCGQSGRTITVRLGPWHRGHDPKDEHLAIAFYRDGELIRSYSTLDISGNAKAGNTGISQYQNVSASVSHYTVFAELPEMVLDVVAADADAVFFERWIVRAKTVDGRELRFDLETGELF